MKVQVVDYLRDMFSLSKLQCFAKCPRMAFFRYVARMKMPPSESLIIGRAVHTGQEHDNAERLKDRRPSKDEVLDAAASRYEVEAGRDMDGFVREHNDQLISFWESGMRDRIQPMPGSVEAPFEIDLMCTPDPENEEPRLATVQGFVDVLSWPEADVKTVIDYKALGKKMSDAAAEDSIQADLYMLGSEAEAAQFVNFIRYQKQRARTAMTKVVRMTQVKMQKLLTFLNDTISSFRKNLKSEDWPKCDPGCWWCSAQACEYYDKCYPKKNPHLVKFISIKDVRPVGTLEQPEWRKKKDKA